MEFFTQKLNVKTKIPKHTKINIKISTCAIDNNKTNYLDKVKDTNNYPINIKIPWVEKYRPKNSTEILLEPFIKQKIKKILETKSIPNMIITGEPGTGKTSTILFLAKQIYGDKYIDNVLELNASDDRGLSIINNTIFPFCKKKTGCIINNETKSNKYPNHKLVILDEADSITPKAQNLLSNIISKFRINTRIVFICNDCTKIIESIQSRCMIIKYPRINSANLYHKIEYICNKENIPYTIDGINTLLFVSDQDIRQSINNLECIYYSFGQLDENIIYKLIDKPKPYYIAQILKSCYTNDFNHTIDIVKSLYNKGYTPNDILLTFMKYLFENNNIDMQPNNSELKYETKLKIYEIISLSYIRVNGGIDTLLQLCGCISKIYLYLQNE
jgi:replication factor C subunit 2/4